MKNMNCKKILIILLLSINSYPIFSQINSDFIKYWFYRDRLNKYFVIPGQQIGESQVVCVRNRINPYHLDDPNDTFKTNIDYGQHGTYQGLYIGVLATEYYLLTKNGQTADANKTYNELYDALHTESLYNDFYAESFWGKTDNNDGFFIRENIPCDFLDTANTFVNDHAFTIDGKRHLDLLNKKLKPSDRWNSSSKTFGTLPKGHPGYVNHNVSSICGGTSYSTAVSPSTEDSPAHPESMSQDDAIGLILGLSLTAKLADGTACQVIAKDMIDKILTRTLNLDFQNNGVPFVLFEPDGSVVGEDPNFNVWHKLAGLSNKGGISWPLGPGLFESGYKLTGNLKYRAWPIIWAILESTYLGYPAQQIVWQLVMEGAGKYDDLTAMLLAYGNYSSARIQGITHKKNWDTFYTLLWEVLNDRRRKPHHQTDLLTKSLDQLNNGPCEGPYCYDNLTFSGGGWGATYKWFKGNDAQNNGDYGFAGNYNGTDYMLLYNLYHIKTNGSSPYYVNYVDRNLIGTVNSSTNFIGFNSITSTQIINQSAQPVTYKAGDSIHLKKGFHAIAGSNFHASLNEINCEGGSLYPDNMNTDFFDSLISNHKQSFDDTEDDDTLINNTITLPCPNDTISLGDSTIDNYYTSYHWDFGNGQISTLPNPKVYYAVPGNYNITLIVTDSSGVIDTLHISVVAPDCKFYGKLYENPSCGGGFISGDSLYLAHNGTIVNTVDPAITQMDGSFTFNTSQALQLDTTLLYSIVSKSGISLIQHAPQKISQWIAQSPITLYYATTIHQEWVQRYNGANSLVDGATAIDLNGNVYVSGATTSSTSGFNMLTIKYNPSGTQQWSQIYTANGSNYNDIARAITVDDSGTVYIAGESYPTNSPYLTTLSYTTDGTLRWVHTYSNFNSQISAKCILQDHAGNIIVGGTSTSSSGTTYYTILKYSKSGSLLWSTNYNGQVSPDHNVLQALSIDTNNNIYASGYSTGVAGNYDMATIRLNSSDGTYSWIARYNNADNGDDFAYSNAVSKNGNIIVSGYSHRNGGTDEVTVLCYNPSSTTPTWVSRYNTDSHDYSYKVLCNSLNNIYIGGYSGNTTNSSLLTLKYNSSGSLLWDNYSLSTSNFLFTSAALDNADNLYCTGTTKNINGYTDITTQKLNSSAVTQWTMTYDGTGSNNDAPTQVMVSENGNTYVCGNSIGVGSNYDFITIKYSQCLSTASELKTTEPSTSSNTIDTSKRTSFVKIIPNPNNGNMQVVYQNPENSNGLFNVYDVMGNLILSYPLNQGANTLQISRIDLNQGIYFYRAIVGNKLLGKDKIVVIK